MLACGEMSRYLCETAGERAVYFNSKEELIAQLPEYIRKGDCVLVKASLGMHMETAAEALKKMKETI